MMNKPQITPFTFEINLDTAELDSYDNRLVRRLSSMRGQYLDQSAFSAMLTQDDMVLYEVFEISRPEFSGELLNGLSVLYPGRVGNEYFMTKGHFHTVLETAEIYYCLKGQGMMVMETPEGDWSVEELLPGRVLYVPPRWAHRSVNTRDTEKLVTFFVYPGHAGHDYGTIEVQGFRKLVIQENGSPKVIDNPRWQTPGERA